MCIRYTHLSHKRLNQRSCTCNRWLALNIWGSILVPIVRIVVTRPKPWARIILWQLSRHPWCWSSRDREDRCTAFGRRKGNNDKLLKPQENTKHLWEFVPPVGSSNCYYSGHWSSYSYTTADGWHTGAKVSYTMYICRKNYTKKKNNPTVAKKISTHCWRLHRTRELY